jgi:hypothetical protein
MGCNMGVAKILGLKNDPGSKVRFFENFFLNIFIWNCIQAKQVDP